MAAPNKKTPERIKRMVELHAGGKSAREIGEALGVQDKTIASWLASQGLAPNGGKGRRADRERPPVVASLPSPALPSVDPDLLRAVDPSDPYDVVQRRLATVSGTLDRLGPAVEREQYAAAQYGALVKIESDLAARVKELTPVVPPDPEKDVTNLDEAAKLRARLAMLVGRAEESARCLHCGLPPFGRVGS